VAPRLRRRASTPRVSKLRSRRLYRTDACG
jgi:hypothetical protein